MQNITAQFSNKKASHSLQILAQQPSHSSQRFLGDLQDKLPFKVSRCFKRNIKFKACKSKDVISKLRGFTEKKNWESATYVSEAQHSSKDVANLERLLQEFCQALSPVVLHCADPPREPGRRQPRPAALASPASGTQKTQTGSPSIF